MHALSVAPQRADFSFFWRFGRYLATNEALDPLRRVGGPENVRNTACPHAAPSSDRVALRRAASAAEIFRPRVKFWEDQSGLVTTAVPLSYDLLLCDGNLPFQV